MRLPRRTGIVLHGSSAVKNTARRCILPCFRQECCDYTLRRSVLRLITVHRILITSGIAVCLLYAGREVVNYTAVYSAAPLIHAALSVAAAAALALYLRSIRRL